MLNIYLAVVAALATKELYFEAWGWYRSWQFKKERKDFELFMEQMEDQEADDDDED